MFGIDAGWAGGSVGMGMAWRVVLGYFYRGSRNATVDTISPSDALCDRHDRGLSLTGGDLSLAAGAANLGSL